MITLLVLNLGDFDLVTFQGFMNSFEKNKESCQVCLLLAQLKDKELLEKVSNMTQQEAHDELMEVIEKKMENEVAAYIRDQEEEAKAKANDAASKAINDAASKLLGNLHNVTSI